MTWVDLVFQSLSLSENWSAWHAQDRIVFRQRSERQRNAWKDMVWEIRPGPEVYYVHRNGETPASAPRTKNLIEAWGLSPSLPDL